MKHMNEISKLTKVGYWWCGFVNASKQGCGVVGAWVCKCEEYFGTNFMNSLLGCTFITPPLTKHHPSNDMVLMCH